MRNWSQLPQGARLPLIETRKVRRCDGAADYWMRGKICPKRINETLQDPFSPGGEGVQGLLLLLATDRAGADGAQMAEGIVRAAAAPDQVRREDRARAPLSHQA